MTTTESKANGVMPDWLMMQSYMPNKDRDLPGHTDYTYRVGELKRAWEYLIERMESMLDFSQERFMHAVRDPNNLLVNFCSGYPSKTEGLLQLLSEIQPGFDRERLVCVDFGDDVVSAHQACGGLTGVELVQSSTEWFFGEGLDSRKGQRIVALGLTVSGISVVDVARAVQRGQVEWGMAFTSQPGYEAEPELWQSCKDWEVVRYYLDMEPNLRKVVHAGAPHYTQERYAIDMMYLLVNCLVQRPDSEKFRGLMCGVRVNPNKPWEKSGL